MITNQLLSTFVEVAQVKTMHAAAKTLGLTQTAVTKRIRALEDDLGVTLYLRSRRGMTLTDEGKSLLQYCKTVQDAEGLLLSQIRGQSRQDVSLTILGPTSAISTRVARDLEPLYLKFPFLRLHLRSNDHTDIVEEIRSGQADLGVVPSGKVPKEMDSKRLKPDRYLLVASSKWKGRRFSQILSQERIFDFYESDGTTLDYLRLHNLVAGGRERIYINENEALIRLFVAGVGYGTLTEDVALKHIEDGKLIVLNGGRAMEHSLALTWYPRGHKSLHFEELVRAIK